MSYRKPIFLTADWHCFHKKAIEFDNRPFKDIHHMHRVLVNNYNASVPTYGICYFVGDMGLASYETLGKIVHELNGTKVLILGNHDKKINAMYRVGFDVVVYGLVLYVASERVTISHCPLKEVWREDLSHIKNSKDDNWHGESRPKHTCLTFTDEGQFHIHGHIHSRKDKKQSQKILGRQLDIGITANNYRPVSISEIESWITLTKRSYHE